MFAGLVCGASRGLGLEMIKCVLRGGRFTTIFAASRTIDKSLNDVFNAQQLQLVQLDVTSETSMSEAKIHIQDQLKHTGQNLNFVFNCAGILHDENHNIHPERRFEQISLESMKQIFAVNTFGPALVGKYFGPLLASHQDRAVLANVSARVGSIGDNHIGGWYTYRASKAAQNQITRTLAIELRRRNSNSICVALHPGTVATDLSAPFQRNVRPEKLFTPEYAANKLFDVLNDLTPEHTGRFYAYDGSQIPW